MLFKNEYGNKRKAVHEKYPTQCEGGAIAGFKNQLLIFYFRRRQRGTASCRAAENKPCFAE